MTITEMRSMYKRGWTVAAIMAKAGIEDGDPTAIKRVLEAKPSARRRATRRSSKRTNYAAQVLDRGNAMAELVGRVNQAATPAPAIANDPIPFDGSCDDAPEETTGRDWYGA